MDIQFDDLFYLEPSFLVENLCCYPESGPLPSFSIFGLVLCLGMPTMASCDVKYWRKAVIEMIEKLYTFYRPDDIISSYRLALAESIQL